MRIGRLLLCCLASVASLAGCTRASLLVCREVSPEGVCRQPTTELVVGRQYTLFATGFGLPHGRVELRVHETVAGVERQIASATTQIPDGQRFLAHPLTVPHVGEYRVELLDDDGDRFRSIRLRAPRPTFHTTAQPVPTVPLPSLQPSPPPSAP